MSADGQVIVDTKSSVSAPPVCEITLSDQPGSIELFRHPDVPEVCPRSFIGPSPMEDFHLCCCRTASPEVCECTLVCASLRVCVTRVSMSLSLVGCFGCWEGGSLTWWHPVPEQYVVPELVSFTSEKHGHEIYGRVYRATQRADDREAPTILHVYGGPLVQFVTNKYGGGTLKASLWARMGFNVVSFDNCGSLNRGLAFEGMLKYKLGDLEVEDQVRCPPHLSFCLQTLYITARVARSM